MLQRAQLWRAGLTAWAAILVAGCLPSDFEGVLPELVLSAGPTPPPSERYAEIEPNENYDSADLVSFIDSVELVGEIAAGTDRLDRDVYEIGPADAGDRIQADIYANIAADLQFALFDDQGRLLQMINHSLYSASPSAIDIVLRESTAALYAVATTRSVSDVPRAYSAYVSREPAGTWSYQPQVVVLNFVGGDGIRIGGRFPIDIPPFDAANIGPQFAGQTAWLINRVTELVAEDYAGLDITLYLAGDPAIPAGEVTTIYFGTYDERLLGLADNIDPFNADHSQAAVLYTDTFALFNALSPDAEAIAQVLANVTSHEIGHLLGLRHTTDVRGIMDITASARQMLLDQWFRVSDLHPTVLSMGQQDAASLLAWTLGGTPPKPPETRLDTLRRAAEAADDPNDFYIPHGMLATSFGGPE